MDEKDDHRLHFPVNFHICQNFRQMDATHLHLLTNHIPILGSAFGFILLLIGMLMKNKTIEMTALTTIVVVTLLTLPAYFSGDEAEHAVEHFAGVSEHELEEHEEHAETTLWLMLATGFMAAMTIASYFKAQRNLKWFRIATLVICGFAFLSMIPLALHGGKIMHQELRGEALPSAEVDHDD